MSQAYSFGFAGSFMAAHAGVSLKSTHFDVDAILRMYEAVKPLAADLGVEVPRPRLAGSSSPPASDNHGYGREFCICCHILNNTPTITWNNNVG